MLSLHLFYQSAGSAHYSRSRSANGAPLPQCLNIVLVLPHFECLHLQNRLNKAQKDKITQFRGILGSRCAWHSMLLLAAPFLVYFRRNCSNLAWSPVLWPRVFITFGCFSAHFMLRALSGSRLTHRLPCNLPCSEKIAYDCLRAQGWSLEAAIDYFYSMGHVGSGPSVDQAAIDALFQKYKGAPFWLVNFAFHSPRRDVHAPMLLAPPPGTTHAACLSRVHGNICTALEAHPAS